MELSDDAYSTKLWYSINDKLFYDDLNILMNSEEPKLTSTLYVVTATRPRVNELLNIDDTINDIETSIESNIYDLNSDFDDSFECNLFIPDIPRQELKSYLQKFIKTYMPTDFYVPRSTEEYKLYEYLTTANKENLAKLKVGDLVYNSDSSGRCEIVYINKQSLEQKPIVVKCVKTGTIYSYTDEGKQFHDNIYVSIVPIENRDWIW